MRLGRIVRRVHARWRLHRMEWNNLYAPLEPPKGYEKYHSEKEVFPGLAHPVKIRNWAELKYALRGGWKIYMHTYRHDPEVQKWLDKMDEDDEKRYKKRGMDAADFMSDVATRGRTNLETLNKELNEAKPDGKQYLKNRAVVFQNAISEFASGFYETVDGKKNVWGATPNKDDEDEYPIVYRVRGGGE